MLHIAPGDVRLSAYMSRVDEILAEARALRVTMMKRIESLDEAISVFERMKRETPPEVLDQILSGAPRTQPNIEKGEALPPALAAASAKRLAPTPADVVMLAERELLANMRPMKRGEIVRALQAKGHQLVGKDANKNLGTILWRHPSKFVTIEGLGYWVKGVPLRGVYDPEQDTEPSP